MTQRELCETKLLPSLIRVSSGSAIVLGLVEGLLKAKPTTAYLLTYLKGKCTANCGFCSQARDSQGRADMLSRVTWPAFPTEKVLVGLATTARLKEIKRVCIQALNYPTVFQDLHALVSEINQQAPELRISISCQPLNKEKMAKLAGTGVERMGIPIDAATKEIFDRVKGCSANGPYDWNKQRKALLDAVQVFGMDKVTTHLILGLGETEEEMVEIIQWCVDNNIHPALFSFTPISGTRLEHLAQPSVDHYRDVQLARHLIVEGKSKFAKIRFDEEGRVVDFGVSEELLRASIRGGSPFLTSGCPHCNRPYYNEKPSGPIYNFPAQPTPREIEDIEKQLKIKD